MINCFLTDHHPLWCALDSPLDSRRINETSVRLVRRPAPAPRSASVTLPAAAEFATVLGCATSALAEADAAGAALRLSRAWGFFFSFLSCFFFLIAHT
jgi:hypothetical protein